MSTSDYVEPSRPIGNARYLRLGIGWFFSVIALYSANRFLDRVAGNELIMSNTSLVVEQVAYILIAGFVIVLGFWAGMETVFVASRFEMPMARLYTFSMIAFLIYTTQTLVLPVAQGTYGYGARMWQANTLVAQANHIHARANDERLSLPSVDSDTVPRSGSLGGAGTGPVIDQYDENRYLYPITCARFFSPGNPEDRPFDFGFSFWDPDMKITHRLVISSSGLPTFAMNRYGSWASLDTEYLMRYFHTITSQDALNTGNSVDLCVMFDTEWVYLMVNGTLYVAYKHHLGQSYFSVSVITGHYSGNWHPDFEVRYSNFTVRYFDQADMLPPSSSPPV